MTYASPYNEFRFESYHYDTESSVLTFNYSFDGQLTFCERVTFETHRTYDGDTFDRALRLAFIIAGISYYKLFPTPKLVINDWKLDQNQADFYNRVYRDGLSQFVFENHLTPEAIGKFENNDSALPTVSRYEGDGIAVLQSGGKDSLLLANLLKNKDTVFTALYMQQGASHPSVIDKLVVPFRRFKRAIDRAAIEAAMSQGGMNGHVPVTYITLAYAVVDAVLTNGNTILSAIGKEGDEPHAFIGNYAITHQWSKTWEAEQLFVEYVKKYVADTIQIGSPLRGISELKIAELFVSECWQDFGHDFSSCNVANYQQGQNNVRLTWCGACPKCANSYLLFSAFVPVQEITELFGRELYAAVDLEETFKGLLGIDDTMKPFECVGEVDELRLAYQLSRQNGYPSLPFMVPTSDFDIDSISPSQSWASRMIQ